MNKRENGVAKLADALEGVVTHAVEQASTKAAKEAVADIQTQLDDHRNKTVQAVKDVIVNS